MSQAVITRLECLVDDVARVNPPNGRHRRVRRPIGKLNLPVRFVEQEAYVFIALLAKTLDRLPGVDVFESNLLDPKIVNTDDTERDLSRAEPLIEERLDDLRRIRILKSDRFKDEIILEPFSRIARAEMNDDTCVLSVITAYVIAQQPVKHRHKISRLAPVRADRRLDQDFVVSVEERAIAIRRRQLVPPEIGDITPTQVSDITPPR